MNEYPVSIERIYISPGHNFYKNKMGEPGQHPLHDVESVHAVAGAGLEGDRFFHPGKAGKGPITFFAYEVYELMKKELGFDRAKSGDYRRNVIVRGMALNQLVGQKFEIGGLEFEGTMECSPCDWMNVVIGPGTRDFLRGRGGLRAKILKGGELKTGATTLRTEVNFSPEDILKQYDELQT